MRHSLTRRYGTTPRQLSPPPVLTVLGNSSLFCCCYWALTNTLRTRATSLVRNSMSALLRTGFCWSHSMHGCRVQLLGRGTGKNVEQRCSLCDLLAKVSVFRTQRCCFGKLRPWLRFKTERWNITIAITQTNTHQIQHLFLVACVLVKFLTWTQLSIFSSKLMGLHPPPEHCCQGALEESLQRSSWQCR